MSAELTALFSLLLRSPDKRSPRGAREGPWLPGEATPGPQSSFRSGRRLSPSTCPPVLCCPTGSSCVLSLLSESVRHHRGVWPRTQWGCTGVPGGLSPPAFPDWALAVCPEEEDEEGVRWAAAEPAREADGTGPGRTDSWAKKWPLLVPQTVRIAFIFLSFQYILNRPKNKSILPRMRPRRQSPRSTGGPGAETCWWPLRGGEGGPAEAPTPRTPRRALGGPRMPASPAGRVRQSPHAEPAALGTQTDACALPFCT